MAYSLRVWTRHKCLNQFRGVSDLDEQGDQMTTALKSARKFFLTRPAQTWPIFNTPDLCSLPSENAQTCTVFLQGRSLEQWIWTGTRTQLLLQDSSFLRWTIHMQLKLMSMRPQKSEFLHYITRWLTYQLLFNTESAHSTIFFSSSLTTWFLWRTKKTGIMFATGYVF